MIVARIMGGLGNQMFQYAAARRLALARHTELRLDVEYFAAQSKRQFALDGWRIRGAVATPRELSFFLPRKKGQRVVNLLRARWRGEPTPAILREQHFHFQPEVLSAPDNTYLDGYWQSEKYFAEIADTLREEFMPAVPLSPRAAALAAEIAARDSISVHVRRGDYVQEAGIREIHGVCPLEYYQESVRRLAEALSRDGAAGDLGSTGVPPVPAGVSPGGPRGAATHALVNATRRVDDSAGRRAGQAGRLCYPSWGNAPTESFDPHCYVFSDDPSWVEDNLQLDVPCTFVAPESAGGEVVDLHLMSRCRHHVIANSSFSWWAAWLNPSPHKRVLAPAHWFAQAAGRDTRDLLPPAWEKVTLEEVHA